MKKLRGFTLIEMLITVAVGAILLSLAVPSFQDIIRENRLATQANELISALNLARSEAIKRGRNVTVTPSGGGWNSGWVIATTDPDTGAAVTLRNFDAVHTNFSIAGGNASYTYLPTGYRDDFNGVDVAADSFTLCATDVSGKPGRSIVVTPSGRPRVETVNGSC